ncbi:MAG: gliding motility-associated C-terminal domain-containing protein [Bacteroidota bacterium]|nr:gliding motility-associated C-terminal domain-containing protein [Bacteroidota bacterium]
MFSIIPMRLQGVLNVFFLYLSFYSFAHINPINPKTILGTGESLIQFTPNKGQFYPFVKLKAEISGGEFYVSGNAFYYHFIDFDKLHSITHGNPEDDTLSTTLLKVAFKNGNKKPIISYSGAFPDYKNYFIGNDSSKWHSNVYSYKKFILSEMYPNVDVQVTSKGEDLKYDLVIKPGGDISKIKMTYEGAKSMQLVSNNLVIETNQSRITEFIPEAYQIIKGKKVKVNCNYLLNGNEVGFSIGANYNPAYDLVIDPQIVFSSYTGSKADNFGYTATFDQDGNTYVGGVVFSIGAFARLYFGFSKIDSARIDNGGDPFNYYPVDSFPFSPTAYKIKYQGGFTDVVIFKFSRDGKRRLYATYLGGNGAETPHSMVVNRNNQLIVFGATGSLNFPETSGVILTTGTGSFFTTYTNDLAFTNGSQVFVSILNELGTDLNASLVVRTNGNSGINYLDKTGFTPTLPTENYYNFGDNYRGEVICDTLDNIYVATYTEAIQIPLENTSKVFTSTDKSDAWIFKLSKDLTQILFSKRVGGTGTDVAYGLQPDSKENLFFAGHTNSTDMFGSITGLNIAPFGQMDGYVAKLDPSGNLVAATYLGTPQDDQAFFVQTDLNNNVYVMGQTWSNNYPIASTGTSSFWSDPGSGQFIHKLNNSLSGTIFSTAFGSGIQGPDISPTAFLVDNCGLIYISGWRGSLKSPEFAGSPSRRLPLKNQLPYNPTSASGFYFVVFGKNMEGIVQGTYFGNDGIDHVDGGTSRFDKRGYIHQAICAGCRGTNITPTTPADVWSPTNKSNNCNMLGVKFDFETVDIKANFTSTPPLKNDTIKVKEGQNIVFQFTGNTISGANVSWFNFKYPSTNRNDKRFITEEPVWTAQPVFPLPTFMSLRKWFIEVDYAKSEDCIQRDDQTFFVVVEPSIINANICNGDTGQFDVKGNIGFAKWTPISGLSNPDIKNPKVWTPKDEVYNVRLVANDNSYSGNYTATVSAINYQPKSAYKFTSDSSGTVPHTVFVENESTFNNGKYLWNLGNGSTLSGKNIGYTFDKIGRYNLKLKASQDSAACSFADSISKYVFVLPKINDVIYCPERPIVNYTIDGGILCLWNTSVSGVKLDKNNGCATTVTLPSPLISFPNVIVYSELNQPYSYVFTVTAKSRAFVPTIYFYDTTTQRETDNILVKFEGKTPVRTRTWDTGNKQKYTDSTFKTTYYKSDKYTIIISGIDTNGCRYRTEWPLDLNLMIIPNVFTPNNDGVNDQFEISGLNRQKTTLNVFNRWGQQVYQSGENNYYNNWKAENLAEGVYYYTIKFNHETPRTYKGWVQVLR